MTTKEVTSQDKELVKTSTNKPARDEKGRLLPGNTANPNGTPKLTEVEKLARRKLKNMVDLYLTEQEKNIAERLPEVTDALLDKATKGDIPAIKEVHEVLGAHKNKGGNTIVPIQINFGEDRNKYA